MKLFFYLRFTIKHKLILKNLVHSTSTFYVNLINYKKVNFVAKPIIDIKCY